MKKSILIIAAIIVSLIGVNAQQSLIEQEQNLEVIEESQLDLYESMMDDFDIWHKDDTRSEMIEDEMHLCLYTEILEDMELHNIVEAKRQLDRESDQLYRSLKEDLIIYDVLSITEIKF